MQSVDYRYNIRGWLRSINNAELTTGDDNDDANDYFGMELLYENAETGLNDGANEQYFNGNISALKWKSFGTDAGTAGQSGYKFLYDKSNKLEKATFQARGTASWNQAVNTLNEEMSYDHNGNIKTLKRNKNKHGLDGVTVTNNPLTIDNLVYTYGQNDNTLTKVEDLTGKAEGFDNGASETTEYAYDTGGSLTEDQNKGITSITYNMLGKPRVIVFSDGRKVEYTYDAAGNKIAVTNFEGTTLVSKTDYSGGFVYQNDVLSFFSSPEGRVVKNGNNFEYQYAIADHQGNTRIVFTSAASTPASITATHEGDTADDIDQFENVEINNIVPFLAANHTPGGMNVVRMNQSYSVGPSKSMKVFPGDKVDIQVWEYHEGTGYGGYAAPLNTLVSMVAGVFGGVSGAPGDPGSIFNGINNAFTAFAPAEDPDDESPAAYLNYILFDTDYKILDMGWQRAPEAAYTKQQLAFPTLDIKHPGYLFVYLSYDDESNNWVFFDDFKVTHTPTNIIQSNEYYPFGLQTANSWTRENVTGNNYLHNGGTELNPSTGNYDLFFRGYDPALGRMLQIDPMASKYSGITPYNFAFNSPAIWNDPSGADPDGSAKAYYNEVMTSMYGEHWKEQRRNLGVVGDDDLFGRPGTIGFKGFGEWVTIPTKKKVWRPTSNDPRNMEWEYKDVKKFVLFDPSKDINVANSTWPQDNNLWDLNGDGRLSHKEANNWYREGNGQEITVAAALVDLSYVDPQKFSSHRTIVVNLLKIGPVSDGIVYGQLELTYQGDNRVTIEPNAYDFHVGGTEHPWFGHGNFWRNIFTVLGNFVASDLRSGEEFMIHFQGEGYLRAAPTFIHVPENTKRR